MNSGGVVCKKKKQFPFWGFWKHFAEFLNAKILAKYSTKIVHKYFKLIIYSK